MIGKKFGRWTILSKSDIRKNDRIYWNCRCDCGTERAVNGVDLRRGASKSCGCLQKELAAEKNSLKLVGKRFNRLVVLEDSGQRQDGMILWKCQCDCGNITYTPTSYLTSGDTGSCGCYQKDQTSQASRKDIAGQRFGKLVALEPTDMRSGKAIKWKCQCDCGNITYVAITSLNQGLTKSCGCLKSWGEEKIGYLLTQNNIPFVKEKTFDSCRSPETNTLLRFDFYVNNSYLVEYDGEQHFMAAGKDWNTEENFAKIQQRDKFKNDWCKENNIQLIRIPYTHLSDISLNDLIPSKNNPYQVC